MLSLFGFLSETRNIFSLLNCLRPYRGCWLRVVNRHGVKDRRVRGGDYLSIQTPKTVKVNSLYKMPATKGAGVKIFSTFILTRRVHQMVTFPFEGYKKNVTGNIVQLLKTCLLLRIGVLLHPLPAVDHSPSPFSSSQVIL